MINQSGVCSGFLLAMSLLHHSVAPSYAQSEGLSGNHWSIKQIKTYDLDNGAQSSFRPIRVGTPLVVDEANFLNEVKWGVEWLTDPLSAKARTKLRLYKLDDILNNFDEVQHELDAKNLKSALAGPRFDGSSLVAFPIRWDDDFSSALMKASAAQGTDFELKLPKAEFLYNEVVKASARAETEKFLYANGWTEESEITWGTEDKLKMDFSAMDSEKFAMNSGPISSGPFFAVEAELNSLSDIGVFPITEVLTSTNLYGAEIGADGVAWPSDITSEMLEAIKRGVVADTHIGNNPEGISQEN